MANLWTAHLNGQTFTRSAVQRSYSHVIVNEYSNGELQAAAWCGDLQLARGRKTKEERHQAALNWKREEMGTPRVITTHMLPVALEPAQPRSIGARRVAVTA